MNRASPDSRAFAVLAALGVVWGASFVFIKVIVEDISAVELATARLTLGAITVLGIVVVRRTRLAVTRRALLELTGIALFANVLPFVLIGWSEERIDSGVASVLNATMPIFTACFAAFAFADERFTVARAGGLVLGFAGTMVLVGEDVVRITDSAVLAQLAVVLAGACYGASSTYMRTLLETYDAVALSALQLTLGALLGWPILLAVDGTPAFGGMDVEAWLSLLALGIGGTGVGYVAYVWLIETTGSVRASLVTYIIPVTGLLLGWLVLGEEVGLNVLAGAALIVGGVALVLRPGSEVAAEGVVVRVGAD